MMLEPSSTHVEEKSDSEFEDEDDESDREWEVITIDDDDDRPRKAPQELICYRCPNNKNGRFNNEKKYWAHIKRHILPDQFACATCQRPFIKMNHCLSHELRVHGTPLVYDVKDQVMTLAKAYVKQRQQNNTDGKDFNHQENTQKDEDSDSEDVKFYGNQFNTSAAIYPYRGPQVSTMLEAYEIQHFKLRPKSSRANGMAKIAIDVHKQNVAKKHDVFRLGRFSRQTAGRTKAAPAPPKRTAKEKTAPCRPATKKRARNAISESENEEKEAEAPKKKRRVVVQYITSSSSSSSPSAGSDDSEFVPEQEAHTGPSRARQREKASGKKNLPVNGKNKRCFPALLNPVCQLCKYTWETEEELKLHRDLKHPNIPVLELLAIPVKNKASSQKRKQVESMPEAKKATENKKDQSKAVVKTRKRKRSDSNIENASPPRKRPQRKGRSQVVRPAFPVPDSTFSRKEIFLHTLQLTNCVRLHLHRKKAIDELKLPQCSVVLERMSDIQVDYYRQNASSLHNFLMPHFLLG